MITSKVVERDTEPMVLILRDDKLIGVIHRHEEGIRLASQYYDGIKSDPGMPPAVIIQFSERAGKS